MQNIIRLLEEVVHIKKNFYLASNYNPKKGQSAIDDLNNLLKNVGVSFSVSVVGMEKKLFIQVDEKKLKAATDKKVGRPVEHDIDFTIVAQMKDNGMTNKQIYTELGISKSLFYLRMKEYKNNIGQKIIDKRGKKKVKKLIDNITPYIGE